MKRRALLRAAFGSTLLALALPGPAQAQGRYPESPIRIVVPFGAGGSTDVLARKLAAKLGVILDVPIVVDNKAGAAGTIGCAQVARAKPDGYTLLMATTGTHVINPSTMVNPSYDAIRDFAPIAVIGTQPFSVAVHSSLGVRTVSELAALLRAHPGKYAYASAGAGGLAHLTAELFKQQAGGLEITHVPYKGGGPAMQDVVAGHVPIFFDSFSTTLPQHRAGRIRVLATTGQKRSAVAQDIPTSIEAGMPGLFSETAGILLAPAGTPRPIIDTLHKAVAKAMSDEGFLKELEALSIEPVIEGGPEKADRYLRAEIARWAPVIKATGTRME